MGNSTFEIKLSKTDQEKVHTIELGGKKSTLVCPPPMMGEVEDATSPHHLFLASVGACVNLVFEIALSKARIDLIDIKSDISGDYETDEKTNESRFTKVRITTYATVPEGVAESKLQRLYSLAHGNCPIGNCLVGSCVDLETKLEITYK
ncbi:MAG: hypothetical protein BAJATHORv1_20581 [Candidatus Thorarchaeota archaeon]|nr:MAG: hypothetical protein BAJATHORv1_20581 [Candidatus Thorarchaeota archaeon]